MTHFRHILKIGLLAFGLLLLTAVSPAQTCPPAAEKIAKAYGLDSFGQIDAIRYTFNAEFPGVKLSRSWIWEPKADRVTYEGKDKAGNPVKATYVRSQLSSQPENVQKEIDPSFVNDQYSLIFPFLAYWDAGKWTMVMRQYLGMGQHHRSIDSRPGFRPNCYSAQEIQL